MDAAAPSNLAAQRFSSPSRLANCRDRMEWAGAFGDLGTLIPFVVGYVAVLKMDPVGVLLAFGLSKVAVGLFYRTPMPVQPMKAIGGAAIGQAGAITPGMVYGSGLVTAAIWLLLGLTGALDRVAGLASKPVIRGIVLGLGLTFILEAFRMMGSDPVIAAVALVATYLLLSNPRLPAMFVLLMMGVAVAVAQQPDLPGQLVQAGVHLRLPELPISGLSWQDVVMGGLLLAIPQLPRASATPASPWWRRTTISFRIAPLQSEGWASPWG